MRLMVQRHFPFPSLFHQQEELHLPSHFPIIPVQATALSGLAGIWAFHPLKGKTDKGLPQYIDGN